MCVEPLDEPAKAGSSAGVKNPLDEPAKAGSSAGDSEFLYNERKQSQKPEDGSRRTLGCF